MQAPNILEKQIPIQVKTLQQETNKMYKNYQNTYTKNEKFKSKTNLRRNYISPRITRKLSNKRVIPIQIFEFQLVVIQFGDWG